GPFFLDLAGKFFGANCLDEDLDTRLVHVVAATVLVVYAHHGFDVGQQVFPRKEFLDHAAQDGRTAKAAADDHAETDFALFIAYHVQADVMGIGDGAVLFGAIDGDLELARQVGEFRMEGAPLSQDLAPGARIDDFIGGYAGELVGRNVADAVAGGLDAMHLDRGQVFVDIGSLLQLYPVVLDVLAGREVSVATVIVTGDVGQLAHLDARQQAIGNRHAQHVGMTLKVEAVLQPQRAEFIFQQFARQAPPDLVAVLRNTLLDDLLVIF